MNNKLSISLIVLCIVIGLYFLNLSQQKNYQSSSTSLLSIDETNIKKFIIQSGLEALEIQRVDTSWVISGHDSLDIKLNLLNNFFDKIKNAEIQNVMTHKKEKWDKYNIEDSTGTHLAFIDWNDNTLGYYVFGRSASDYSRCYVRKNQDSVVYLLNENIMYSLQMRPEYWGELKKDDDLILPPLQE